MGREEGDGDDRTSPDQQTAEGEVGGSGDTAHKRDMGQAIKHTDSHPRCRHAVTTVTQTRDQPSTL